MKTKIYSVISTSVLALLALILFGTTTVTAAPGDLDPTFGTGGTVITGLLPDYDFAQNAAHRMAIQPDGKIVVSGYGDFYPGFPAFRSFLVRYNPNGTLDLNFGTNGTVIVPYQTPGSFERFQDGLTILPDGKILVSGTAINPPNDRIGFAVFRFNSNGSRDTSFGANGVAVASFGDDNVDTGHTLQVQLDGKIVVVGSIYSCDPFGDCSSADRTYAGVGAARFYANGTIDTAFGTNGKLKILNPADKYYSVADSAVLPDGKLVLFGGIGDQITHDNKVFLSRINPNGTLDASFGTNGILLPDIDQLNYSVYQFALQPDGKIVFPTANLNGNNFGSSTLVRLNPDGTFDASFGTSGKIVITSSEGIFGNSILIQPNGKILAAGQTSETPPFRFAIVRLNADGSRDTTFGSNGVVTTLLDSYGNYISDLVLQPDGKLLACGRTHDSFVTDYDIGLARYVLESPTDTPTPTATPTPTLVPSLTPAPTANGKIAFASNRDGNYEIYLMNSDGTGQVRLTNNPGLDDFPSFSPDGGRIAFASGNADGGDIVIKVMNADGSNQIRLTNNPVADLAPQWSPDGTRIVFTRLTHTSSPSEIFVMNADGGNPTRLTTISPAFDSYPSWSPDGSKIVFECDREFICVMNADGSNRVTLTSFSYAEPRWSHDGKIAYSTLFCDLADICHDPTEIYVMNADGSGQQNLTQSPNVNERSPAWSPDGSKLVFTVWYGSNGGGAADIFTMNRDGTGRMQLTNSPNGSNNRRPSWQPFAPSACPNPIDCAEFFVRQHYRDFLNREPDADGLAFWTNEITLCGGDQSCINAKRINVSAAFFLSVEFQQTGYLVHRFYKVSYGNLPGAPVPIKLNEFLPDTQKIGQGVIVNQAGWEQVLDNNKQAFAAEFVRRSRFTSAYPTSLTPDQFVDQLFSNAGVTPLTTDRAAAINEFGLATTTNDLAARARALRRVAENSTLAQHEFNRAFVLMQYFGYLRRNPNDPPELTLDFEGYNFWLNKLNQFNGNFQDAEMVKAFLLSTEYRQRCGLP